MKKKIIGKLSGQGGETIVETLIALLISALALMMLAGAVNAGMRLVENSRAHMETYYQENNSLAARAAGSASGSLTVSVTDLLPKTGDADITVNYWVNDHFSKTPVVAYQQSVSGSSGT